jgi:tetratricopeptide (TPR) repeat protein
VLTPNPRNDAAPAESAAIESSAPAIQSDVAHPPIPPQQSRGRKKAIRLTAGIIAFIAICILIQSLLIPRLRAWYHAHAARSELKNYHTPQALRHLQECRSLWPDDPELVLLAARAERRALHYAEAERLLEEYRTAGGLDEAVSFEQLLLSAERNVDRVADKCRRYVHEGNEDSALALEALTRGYFRQYHLGAARWCLDRWLELQPNNPQAHYLDGQFQQQFMHNERAAEVAFRWAVELDPEHEEARFAFAIALLASSDNPDAAQAVKNLEFVRERQPDNLRVQTAVAEARNLLGQPAEAIKIADIVLAQDPHFTPALALRGRLAMDQGQYAAAETWLRETLVSDPNNAAARYMLVQCLRHNDKADEAERLEQESKQIQQDILRSDEIITRDLPKSPHSAALQCELGQLFLRRGRIDEGLRWLESALREDNGYEPAQKALKEYQKKGQSKQ